MHSLNVFLLYILAIKAAINNGTLSLPIDVNSIKSTCKFHFFIN